MGVLIGFASVFFVVLCVLLVVLILLQSDKGSGMGILGGSSQSAFGSSTADVITKITAVMVGLFLLGSLGISALESVKSRSIEKSIISGDNKAAAIMEDLSKGESKPAAEGAAKEQQKDK